MSKSNVANQTASHKRLSPELAEVLHMLKSLETQPMANSAVSTTR